ncbi:MAG: hypothetical protein ACRDZO_00915 [Egibacteraceae bacterium]
MSWDRVDEGGAGGWRVSAETSGAPAPSQVRWVGVAWVGGSLLTVRPLARQSAAMGLLGLTEAYPGVERAGVAELLTAEDAARRAAGRARHGTAPDLEVSGSVGGPPTRTAPWSPTRASCWIRPASAPS